MTTLKLVRSDGSLYDFKPAHEPVAALPRDRFKSRVAFAAAHVVADPLRTTEPITTAVIDWEATLSYREYLWSLGLGVAEAMDTAQCGAGLDWPNALELIRRSTTAARAQNRLLACGAGTDHLFPGQARTLQDVIDAYSVQCETIEALGGRIILMSSRALAAVARHADDYAAVYAAVLSEVRQPVILHWLGPMFDLGLAGYNRLAMEEAATLGAPVLVIVSGPPHGQSLGDARATVIDALREVLPDAERAGSRSA